MELKDSEKHTYMNISIKIIQIENLGVFLKFKGFQRNHVFLKKFSIIQGNWEHYFFQVFIFKNILRVLD